VRDVTRVIQADRHVSDAARKDAGIPVHKTTRTPVAKPKTFPLAQVIASDRLEHTLSFANAATPTRRARPKGCTGAEIYLLVDESMPTNPDDYRFVALATRSPHIVTFASVDGGKTANYLLRWINTRGEYGPWSQLVSATVPAV